MTTNLRCISSYDVTVSHSLIYALIAPFSSHGVEMGNFQTRTKIAPKFKSLWLLAALFRMYVCDEPAGGYSQPDSGIKSMWLIEVYWCALGQLNMT